MTYSKEVEEMCPVAQGVHHGCAPIPEEANWVQAKEVKERPDNCIRHDAFGSNVFQTDPSKDEREQESRDTTGITQERLDGISLTLLILVDHVSHHHLEWLHSHVDASIKQHQHQQTE